MSAPIPPAYDGPVHGAFGLSYASFLVWPRVLMQAMPREWQERFVALAEEFNETFTHYEPPRGYTIMGRDERNRYCRPPLSQYRRLDWTEIERAR